MTVGPESEPGSALLAAVAVMDRLRSPGGCPWDAEQTHSSLAPYLLEETYETLEAIENADPVSLREELGDLLLQVLFHARLAEEADGPGRFSIEEVAGDLVAKLTRRHPHVFADHSADSAEQVSANWEEIKRAEKRRESVTDGIAMGQPALSLAAKLVSRSGRAGVRVELPARSGTGDGGSAAGEDGPGTGGPGIGEKLLALVAEAVQAGVDPELALRATARRYRDDIRRQEQEHRDDQPTG